MICDSCINVIMRTTQNGGQDPVTVRVCSLDGANMSYQLKECSRKKEKEVPAPTEIRLVPPAPVLPALKEVHKDKRFKRGT